ncbi:hypothetical protein PCASD_00993 [Puccinia coronata f. sp. avenae]|uniref:Uncharacterized protein n=1 Tax=Puccinia coronata f. sp. avenae TaxID=200324 RepID=A0A2N5VMR7_9BASI|nr:hypothetical protein PCASD_00993 [Puccinia coronata f. sp. avenae]
MKVKKSDDKLCGSRSHREENKTLKQQHPAVDNLLSSPNDLRPVTGGRRTEQSRTVDVFTLSASARELRWTATNCARLPTSSDGVLVQPFASVKMSPAEASNEIQKIVERNFDRTSTSEYSENFDSDSLYGLDDTPIHSNPEHFPVLTDSFPAARKLTSSFLHSANNSLPRYIALLPLSSLG